MEARSSWQELYRVAVLETDWTKMSLRIREAESALARRLRELSLDRVGTMTMEEKQQIAKTRKRLQALRSELARWRDSQSPT